MFVILTLNLQSPKNMKVEDVGVGNTNLTCVGRVQEAVIIFLSQRL